MTEQEYAQFLLVKLEQIRNKTGFHWAVWLKANETGTSSKTPGESPASRTFIGAVNLNPIAGTAMMQIGCQLKRAYWRQGFASELTRRILDFALNEAGLKTVYGVFGKDNQASRRLLEKLGFVWQETKQEAHGVVIEIHKYPAQ
jgi:RimJ/RimL family protein N-acetyltransferase